MTEEIDTTDNDVMIIDSTSNDLVIASLDEHEGKPLMMLFKRLIRNDSKENTVLTNAQIVEILHKEFGMDVIYSHELEIDIYLNVLKKFLKDWPQWDEFDSGINGLKHQRDIAKIKQMLETNYESLKAYLQKTLKTVEPLLEKTITQLKKSTNKEDLIQDDIEMLVNCTRKQLNQLFYRRPHPTCGNLQVTIFNVDADNPTKIRISPFHIDSILNWPGLRISFNVNGALIFKREMSLCLTHVLVNKKLNCHEKPPEELKTNFQMKGAKLSTVDLDSFIGAVDDLNKAKYNSYSTHINDDTKTLIIAVCNLIKSDLADGPAKLQFPAVYRKNLSKSPFRRYLYTDVGPDVPCSNNSFDLHLEETGIPQFQLSLTRFQRNCGIANGNFLRIECTHCGYKFENFNILERLKQHFEDFHRGEPDWHCTRCELSFTMENLTRMKWGHVCEPLDHGKD